MPTLVTLSLISPPFHWEAETKVKGPTLGALYLTPPGYHPVPSISTQSTYSTTVQNPTIDGFWLHLPLTLGILLNLVTLNQSVAEVEKEQDSEFAQY